MISRKYIFLLLLWFIGWWCMILPGCVWLYQTHQYHLPPSTKARGESVVLVHGLGRQCFSMLPVALKLRKSGYDIWLYDYPSSRYGIKHHAAEFAKFINSLQEQDEVEKIHFVTHSLGSIITRQALGPEAEPKIGRIVMLAPPNQGSATATRLARRWPWPILLRPLRELRNSPDSPIHSIPIPNAEIGIIAASRDAKVSVKESRLPGAKDHLVVDAYHSFLPNRSDINSAISNFLENGSFTPPLSP